MTDEQKTENVKRDALKKSLLWFPKKSPAAFDDARGAAKRKCAALILFSAAVFGAYIYFNFTLAQASILAEGDLDQTFDGDGKAAFHYPHDPFFTNTNDSANDAAVQTDGKIVFVGSAEPTSTRAPVVGRLNADGTLDTNFGSGGYTLFPFGAAYAVAIQTDGKIVVALNGGTRVSRFDSNGMLDAAFGSGGTYSTSDSLVTGFYSSTDITLQPDGKILVAGVSLLGSSNSVFRVTRLNANGTPDTTFDGDGHALADFAPGYDLPKSISLQTDGKIVVTGGTNNPTFGNGFFISVGFAVARFNADGTPDAAFDADGKTTVSFNAPYATAEASAIQPDGKILTAGRASTSVIDDISGAHSIAIARLLPNGSPDNNFDSDGQVMTNIPGGSISGLTDVHSRGTKIVATGWSFTSSSPNYAFAVARYNDNGTPDAALDGDGFLLTEFTPNPDVSRASVFQPDGKLILAGFATNPAPNNADFAFARYFFTPLATAAGVTVTGRITARGRGLASAIVYMTDRNGNAKTARTDRFGFYRFDEVETGQTYIFNVYSRQYQFNTQIVTITENLDDLNFTAQR